MATKNNRGHSHFRVAILVLRWFIIGVATGVVFGTAYWCLDLVLSRESIADALKGKVEDALDLLQGLVTLGCLVGGAVGLIYGFLSTRRD